MLVGCVLLTFMRSNEHIADPKYCSPQDSGYEEGGEVAVVEVTNAVVDPGAVVVHLLHTPGVMQVVI